MHYVRDLIHRLRLGQSGRQVAKDLHLSRQTVKKYRGLAKEAGYLADAAELPDIAVLAAALGAPLAPPRQPSTVQPFQAMVEELMGRGVEMMTIFDRLQERGYTGSYSSVRRFVHKLEPTTKALVRVPDRSNDFTLEIAHAADEIDHAALRARCQSIDREIPPLDVVLEISDEFHASWPATVVFSFCAKRRNLV